MKAKDRAFQEAHCLALTGKYRRIIPSHFFEFGEHLTLTRLLRYLMVIDAVLRVVRDDFAKDYGFIEMTVPLGIDKDDTSTPRAHILAT